MIKPTVTLLDGRVVPQCWAFNISAATKERYTDALCRRPEGHDGPHRGGAGYEWPKEQQP